MSKKLTYTEVKNFINGEGYALISEEYISANSPIEVQCGREHKSYKVRFSNFKTGRRCPECAKESRTTTKRIQTREVKRYVEDKRYELIGVSEGVKGSPKKIKVNCREGHKDYTVTYQNFKRGKRCPECYHDKRRTPIHLVRSEIEREGFALADNHFTNVNEPITLECPYGHKYTTSLSMFRAGKRCSQCNQSRGENLVYYILSNVVQKGKINHQYSVNFYGKRFIYDFCILSNENLLIEYDGVQHYNPVSRFGGKERFKEQLISDVYKNVYSFRLKDTQILRIPYYFTELEVYRAIIKFLRYHNVHVKELKNLSDLRGSMYRNTKMDNIASFYESNSLDKTKNTFYVSGSTVMRSFKQVYGTSKTKYLKGG